MKKIFILICLAGVIFVSSSFAEISIYGLIGSDENKRLNVGMDLMFMDKIGVGFQYILNTDSIDPLMTEEAAIAMGAVNHDYEEQLKRSSAVFLIYKFIKEFGVYAGVNLDKIEVYRSYEEPEDTFFWTDVEEKNEYPLAYGIFVDIDGFALQTGINASDSFESMYIMLGLKLFGL